jgi:hypothetical protein
MTGEPSDLRGRQFHLAFDKRLQAIDDLTCLKSSGALVILAKGRAGFAQARDFASDLSTDLALPLRVPLPVRADFPLMGTRERPPQ